MSDPFIEMGRAGCGCIVAVLGIVLGLAGLAVAAMLILSIFIDF